MRFSLRQLRYLVAAADYGSISAAARALHVSQPSISAALAEIEVQYGVELFLRKNSRGVTPTPAGSVFLREARELLSHAADLDATALGLSQEVSGELRVATFVNIAPVFFAQIARTFQELYPKAKITVAVGDQRSVLDRVADGESELALTWDLGLTDEFEIEPIKTFPPKLVLPSDHRLADRETASLAEVADEPFVVLDLPISREYFYSLFESQGLRPVNVIRVASYETIRTFVGNGLGISTLNLVPRNATNYDGTKVVYRAIVEPVRPLILCILRARRSRTRNIADVFTQHVRDFFELNRP